jgi:hypothetical protein
MGAGRCIAVAVGLAACLLAAPAAHASFHLIKVREIYPGQADDSYLELQMYASGQNFVSGHSLTLFDSTGALVHKSTFSANVGNGQNQATILIGDTAVQQTFGLAPDLVDAALSISASGGAACWNAAGSPADCVAWGNFSGGTSFQTATGTTTGSPASPTGITAGKAIRRTIEPGCPTLLEASDDANNSLVDFAEVSPSPRDNASPILERSCPPAPNTVIDEKPPSVTGSNVASFTYEAPTATAYECKLDLAAFASCPATGIQYPSLAEGSHTFQVRGLNASGPDPTPASYTWRVDTTPPTTIIDQHPADPSPGGSASFAFHSDEAGSIFECSLSRASEPVTFDPCVSGKTYTGLADGIYTFGVRAIDLGGNLQVTPTEFSWTVDNSLDVTPPETRIDSFPPSPSLSSTVSFGYASSEPGSTFECSLDDGSFAACPAGGVSYASLANGPHSFLVRAIDFSSNVDLTPAAYSFDVAIPLPPPLPPQTFFSRKPAARTRDRTPTFRFGSDNPIASFQCKLDRAPFRRCRSPFTTKRLQPGRHSLSVRAGAAGAPDPTPARFKFTILGRR